MFFNREYMPLGWNDHWSRSVFKEPFLELPVYTEYVDLDENRLLTIAGNDETAIKRNNDGEIVRVMFYEDRTNPMNSPQCWPDYLNKIRELSKCFQRGVNTLT